MGAVEHGPVLGSNKLATIIDIGANRGQFSLAARAFTSAKIFSFEPLPIACKVFDRVFEDDIDVKLFRAAISCIKGSPKIHLSARDDSSSLLEIGGGQSNFFPGTHEVGVIEVEAGPLDLYLKPEDIVMPSLLKLDVQGYELEALEGCANLIEKFQYIYCECSFVELYTGQSFAHEVISFLNKWNFYLAGIYNPSYDRLGRCIQADLYFIKKE
jgi:FkbM family methyltransferase